MSLAHFLLNSRGIVNLTLRANTLLKRFSFTPAKMESLLDCGIKMHQEFGLKLSLPVTAIILERYPKIIQKLQNNDVELAVHGYVHIDYAKLSKEKQLKHFIRAIKIFKKYGIKFHGFRAPYTRWNKDTFLAIQELAFLWESSKTVLWDVLNKYKSILPEKNWKAYKKVLKLYNPIDASAHPVLPEIKENFVEIPVSLPDDEIMTDRLNLSPETIQKVWKEILKITYERGELFTLQIHPERFKLLKKIIIEVVKDGKNYTPKIWIANLSEIAKWWREKSKFSAKIREVDNGNYKIVFNCSHRATILCRNVLPLQNQIEPWYNSYQRVIAPSNELQIQSKLRPVIGIGSNCSQTLKNFLEGEGYILEQGKKENYGIYFEDIKDFNEFEILKQIEKGDLPLIRFWRWPDGTRSCLSIAGDIDSLTLIDFFMRIFGK